MRDRPLNNQIAIDLGDSVGQRNDTHATSVRCELGERALYLGTVVNAGSSYFNFEWTCQALYRSEKFLVCGRFWMEQDQHTSSCWRRFPKRLKPLAAHRGLKIGKAGYVATG